MILWNKLLEVVDTLLILWNKLLEVVDTLLILWNKLLEVVDTLLVPLFADLTAPVVLGHLIQVIILELLHMVLQHVDEHCQHLHRGRVGRLKGQLQAHFIHEWDKVIDKEALALRKHVYLFVRCHHT